MRRPVELRGRNVSREFVGSLVELEFIEVAGERYTVVGWLRGITSRGVYFARAYRSRSLGRFMAGEVASFYPWELILEVRPLGERDVRAL